MRLNHTLLGAIGRTPLVRLACPAARTGAEVWCKLELMNPGGSVKDRVCYAILESMEAEGTLKPGVTVVEASAGNTAISLAMIAAAKGYPLRLVMPENVSVERRKLLASYGAEIVLSAQANGMKGAVTLADEILEAHDNFVTINQFENPKNPSVHRRTTAVEIVEELGRLPDVFVAGVGTGGTLTGVGEFLKGENPGTRIVAVEPAESPILSGGNPGPHRIPGIGAGFVPRVLNSDIIDHVVTVSFEQASETVEMLAREEGIYVGLSSGAALYAALLQAQERSPESSVVTILCDGGERYQCLGT